MSIDGATALQLEPGGELEDIETRLLLEGIRLCYGYDFREYSSAPMRRALHAAMVREGVQTVSSYQDRVLHDAGCMQRFLSTVGVSLASMFREPDLISCIRQEVVPLFKTYPSVRIWLAGCGTGEEAYAVATVLREQDALGRCSIYATDINDDMLAVARLGTYPLDRMRRYEDAYRLSGGSGRLSDHYAVAGRNVRFDPEITKSITWARHSLASDGSFNDFHLIYCVSLLSFFKPALQERAFRLFYDSLIRSGFLALGRRDSLLCCPDREHFEHLRDGINLYRKLRW